MAARSGLPGPRRPPLLSRVKSPPPEQLRILAPALDAREHALADRHAREPDDAAQGSQMRGGREGARLYTVPGGTAIAACRLLGCRRFRIEHTPNMSQAALTAPPTLRRCP